MTAADHVIDVEQTIRGIFRDVLALDGPVNVDSSFFDDLGGTSIRAARVVARISSRYQVKVPLRVVFEHPTARELARMVEAEVRDDIARLSDEAVLATIKDVE